MEDQPKIVIVVERHSTQPIVLLVHSIQSSWSERCKLNVNVNMNVPHLMLMEFLQMIVDMDYLTMDIIYCDQHLIDLDRLILY